MSTTSTLAMSIICPQSTSSALQPRLLLRQSRQRPAVWHGWSPSKRCMFCTAAVLRARDRALSKSGQILFVPATMYTVLPMP